ncbi:hypothetical protein [Streptomyces griseosporeus]|uniref:hypothetical protein n=1 Tax=Streptomyces griseosporeus TaxID=1910 RepID=UPI003700DF4F
MATGGWRGHDGYGGHDGYDGHGGYGGSGSRPAHGPSEESGRAAWQTGVPDPPAWASAETQVGGVHPAAWTPPPLPPTPPPSGPVGRGRTRGLLAALAVTAVLGVGAGAGFWYLTRDDTPATATSPTTAPTSTTPSASPRAAAPPVPPASPTPTPPPSPSPRSGYRHAEDPVGYALDVPEGWTRRQKQGEKAPVVFYDSPDDGRQLQIFALSEPTPAESLDLAENDPGYGFSAQPGYRPLDRATGADWVELTYRYDDADKGARRVIDHRFRAADGTLYALRSAGPEDVPLARVRAPLTAALASFCPRGAECAR